MKKIISMLLVLVMCVPLLCVNASAASDYKVKISRAYGGGVTYITLDANDGDVYYTTDGSKPTMASKEYTKKIKITKPCTLRVAVYDNNKAQKRYKTSVTVRLTKPTVEMFEYSHDGTYVYDIYDKYDAKYYFTTDGTTPSAKNGERAYGSFAAEPGSTVKIRAVKSGWKSSLVRTIKVPEAPDNVKEEQDDSAAAFAAEVVRLVNKERKAYGLNALDTMTDLTEAAQVRSKELVELFSHNRPDGTSCFTALEEQGFQLNRYWCGENIAAGQRTPAEVVESWMNSEGHRANILSENYTHIGVGCTVTSSGYGFYWSQMFLG